MKIRCYSDLRRLDSLEDRYEYLSLKGQVGERTFGWERYVNQRFYTSREWRNIRNHVIVRDNGCDLGIEGFDIHERAIIHHMNPMTVDDIERGINDILDPEFLITTTHMTHNAIHYGDVRLLPRVFVERHAGDTKLW